MKMFTTAALGAALMFSSVISGNAMPMAGNADLSDMTIQVAAGCGPDAWRGPYGHCRDTPFYGRLPNGTWKLPAANNGCPAGYWRGPWGHCRNTPYHGPLPNGGWKA